MTKAAEPSDWDVKHGAGKALANADKHTLAVLFDRLLNSDKPAWEFGFDLLLPVAVERRQH